jgi:hypothetical protein
MPHHQNTQLKKSKKMKDYIEFQQPQTRSSRKKKNEIGAIAHSSGTWILQGQ